MFNQKSQWYIFSSLLLLCGCATQRHEAPMPESTVLRKPRTTRMPSERMNPPVMGRGKASVAQMAHYLLAQNPRLRPSFALAFAQLYADECAIEGVNHDVAFAQMCHETGALKFGNDVKPEQNNFAGIGAVGNGNPGHSFPSRQIGVRAHIQHLKAYASTEPLRRPKVDPRFDLVKPRGRVHTVNDLTGRWATDPQYAEGLRRHLRGF